MSSRARARFGRLLFAALAVVDVAGAGAAVAAVTPGAARAHALTSDNGSARRRHELAVVDATDQDTVVAATTRADDAHAAVGRFVVAAATVALALVALLVWRRASHTTRARSQPAARDVRHRGPPLLCS